jgi:hypothetical protein
LLVIIVGLCLTMVLFALWHSLRGLLAHTRDGARPPTVSSARAALLREKDELLAAIRELRFEHELGKVSDADFERLEQRYRVRARDVLRELDEQIAPYRARAEELLAQARAAENGAEHTAAAKAKDAPAVAAEAPLVPAAKPNAAPEAARSAGSTSPPRSASAACAQCGTSNDADALFCKKCGRRMHDEALA